MPIHHSRLWASRGQGLKGLFLLFHPPLCVCKLHGHTVSIYWMNVIPDFITFRIQLTPNLESWIPFDLSVGPARWADSDSESEQLWYLRQHHHQFRNVDLPRLGGAALESVMFNNLTMNHVLFIKGNERGRGTCPSPSGQGHHPVLRLSSNTRQC